MHSDINATIDSLKNIKNKMQSASGGVGTLSGAVSSIQARINAENQKLSSIDQLSQRVGTFVNNTITTDAQVAALVNESQEKFFNKYTWLRPSVEEEKNWWEKFVDGWNNFWGDVGDVLSKVLQGVVDFVKEHAVELIIGAVAIIVGAAIIALTGGAAAAFIPALLAGLKAAAISALVAGTMNAVIALFTNGDPLSAFLDGLANGFMWGGIFFMFSSLWSAFSVWRTNNKMYYKQEGGSYSELKKISDSSIEQVHHMPADSTSYLNKGDGSSIIMDTADHKLTASFDNKTGSTAYRLKQKQLIDAGKFMDAFDMDVANIQELFGGKYDVAINKARQYIKILIEKGMIK